VAELGRQVEGVVVGSAIVRVIERYGNDPNLAAHLEDFARQLKAGFESPVTRVKA
jgi:tryptophan synthase alpha subunit